MAKQAGSAGGSEIETGIRRILRAMDLRSRALVRRFDVTGPQLAVLLAVAARPGRTASQIAGSVQLSASTLVGILDRLEERGLIARQRDREDRRKVHIEPTAAGRSLAARVGSGLGEGLDAGLAKLTLRRRRELARDLELLAELIESDS